MIFYCLIILPDLVPFILYYPILNPGLCFIINDGYISYSYYYYTC